MLTHKNSSTISRRRRAIEERIATVGLRILEYGPLDRPTFLKGESIVQYADYYSNSDHYYRDNSSMRSVADVVEIDFATSQGALSTLGAGPFDLLVANHVIEHVPDLIEWFFDAYRVAAPGARMSLIVPDKRFNFDFQRECTDAVELIRNHEDGLVRPSKFQVLRHYFYHQNRANALSLWEKEPTSSMPFMSLPDAIDFSSKAADVYIDSHCSVFTRDSFLNVISQLNGGRLIPWKITYCSEVAYGGAEFHAILDLSSDAMEI